MPTKDSSPSNPLVMPCPFCGKPAQEGPLWPKHYGCSDSECGAYMANVALVKWNRRPADETSEGRWYDGTHAVCGGRIYHNDTRWMRCEKCGHMFDKFSHNVNYCGQVR